MSNGVCGLHDNYEINNLKIEGQAACQFHVKFNSTYALTH